MGAQRSGTTWWHRLVVNHPAMVPASRKELHFFDRFWSGGFSSHDVAHYHKLFPRPEGRLTGEWTPRYMLDFWTPRLLRAAAPDTRVLVMLRDPVERYRSGMAQAVDAAAARGALLPPTACADALERSLYRRQLDRLLEHFPREQTLVLQYERCCDAPERELRRTYEFLGVDPGHLPPGLAAMPPPAGGRAGLPSDLRKDLVAALRSDVDALRWGFPEIDVDLWPDFAPGQ